MFIIRIGPWMNDFPKIFAQIVKWYLNDAGNERDQEKEICNSSFFLGISSTQ